MSEHSSIRTLSRRTGVFVSVLTSLFTAGFGVGSLKAQERSAPLAIIVHPGVPAKILGRAELAAIFTGSLTEWPGGAAIRPVNAPIESATRVEFDKQVLRMSKGRVNQFWLDKKVRGQGTPPRELPTPELIVRLVSALPGSISYVPEDKVSPRVRVVARLVDGKVVAP